MTRGHMTHGIKVSFNSLSKLVLLSTPFRGIHFLFLFVFLIPFTQDDISIDLWKFWYLYYFFKFASRNKSVSRTFQISFFKTFKMILTWSEHSSQSLSHFKRGNLFLTTHSSGIKDKSCENGEENFCSLKHEAIKFHDDDVLQKETFCHNCDYDAIKSVKVTMRHATFN